MNRSRPAAAEFPPFYAGYVAGVPDVDIVTVMRDEGRALASALGAIPEARGGYRYADGKWSIRTLIGHMIDAERIFTYRLLRVARGDATPLPGFAENDYAETAASDARTIASLAAEMETVRESSVQLLDSLPEDAWMRRGTVNGNAVTVRALAYITAGHAKHHLAVLRDRYGM